LKFFIDNWFLFLAALVSGGLLDFLQAMSPSVDAAPGGSAVR